MNLRQLQYFLALAERLNFTAAAKHLGIAQPPLSIQIRKLETDLGGALFTRANRKIALTPLGLLLQTEARALLDQSMRTEERIRDAAGGRSGEIRLAYTDGALSEKITRRIRKFLRKQRGVRLLAARRSYSEISELSSSEFDATITEATSLLPGAITLDKATPQIALPPKHRLADRSEVFLSDLIGENLLLPPFSNRSPVHREIVEAIDHQNVRLNQMESSTDLTDRLWQVSIGTGVTLCSSADRSALDAVRLPLVDCLAEIVIQCVPTSSPRAVALPAFLEAIAE